MHPILLLGMLFVPFVFAEEPADKPAPEPKSTFQIGLDLIESSRKGEIKSVEALIDRLPPEMFEMGNYALAHHSASQHKTNSYLYPRVQLKTRDVNFVLAYPSGPGSQAMDLVEIILSTPENPIPQMYSINYATKPPEVSGPNPSSCTACHSTRHRYNWDPYDKWFGFYGGGEVQTNSGVTTQEERDGWKEFVASEKNKRLKKLKLPSGENSLGKMWSLLADHWTPALFNRNIRHLAQEISTKGALTPYRFALLGAIADCENMDKFFYPASRKNVYQTRFKEKVPEREALSRDADRRIDLKFGVESSSSGTGHSPKIQAKVESVLAFAGETLKDWAPACKGTGAEFARSIGNFWNGPGVSVPFDRKPPPIDPKEQYDPEGTVTEDDTNAYYALTLFDALVLAWNVENQVYRDPFPRYEDEPKGYIVHRMPDCTKLSRLSRKALGEPEAATNRDSKTH